MIRLESKLCFERKSWSVVVREELSRESWREDELLRDERRVVC